MTPSGCCCAMIIISIIFSLTYFLCSPADVEITFVVFLASEEGLDDVRRDVELLEDVRFLRYFPVFDELVQLEKTVKVTPKKRRKMTPKS